MVGTPPATIESVDSYVAIWHPCSVPRKGIIALGLHSCGLDGPSLGARQYTSSAAASKSGGERGIHALCDVLISGLFGPPIRSTRDTPKRREEDRVRTLVCPGKVRRRRSEADVVTSHAASRGRSVWSKQPHIPNRTWQTKLIRSNAALLDFRRHPG